MYCGCNKTALTSQRQIARTMLSLMGKKTYDQISVCELCRSADISRQTFYSLFSSRENVIVFILQDRYFFVPEEDHPAYEETRQKFCGVRSICRQYSEYILRNRDFLQLLVQNHIDYLLFDSIRESLLCCESFLKETEDSIRVYAAGFYAGGISSVARSFAYDGCTSSAEEIERMLYIFFTGRLF